MADYIVVGFFLAGGIAIAAMMMTANRLFSPKRPTPTKLSPYECGEVPVGDARVRFNFRFFIIAICFVIFEVEVLFLFPWAVVYKSLVVMPTFSHAVFWEMVIFVFILFVGWVYAYRRGLLKWE
jgi:NADH-quinone oxidoreductase subunit A